MGNKTIEYTVSLPPNLDEQLERRKKKTGNGKASIIRTAVAKELGEL